jgi:hypothetical protein
VKTQPFLFCGCAAARKKIATRLIAASQKKKYFPILDRQKRKNKSRASRLRNALKENDE